MSNEDEDWPISIREQNRRRRLNPPWDMRHPRLTLAIEIVVAMALWGLMLLPFWAYFTRS